MGNELSMIDNCIMVVLRFGYDHTTVSILVIAIICIICYNVGDKRD